MTFFALDNMGMLLCVWIALVRLLLFSSLSQISTLSKATLLTSSRPSSVSWADLYTLPFSILWQSFQDLGWLNAAM